MKELAKGLLTAAITGIAQQLAINPRNLRLLVLLDDEESTLARVDARTVGDLLNRPARKRVLRIKVGNLAYDINLGSRSHAGPQRRMGKVRQRGDQ